MCGVYGYLSRHEPVQSEVLRRMGETLAHRGPDDAGEWVHHGETVSVGLGHKRLSIIDLSAAARQPVSTEDGQVWLSFNGEIYNFRELRRELVARGHTFKSNSDAEVIIHLYEEKGVGCLKDLHGMFAFALWDDARQTLFLARDRIGKKPLHYAATPAGFVFGSEIRALLCHPDVSRAIDPASLSKYLTLEYVPAPHTMFRSIRKLEPGHYLTHRAGQTDVVKYWDIPLADYPVSSKTEDAYVDELREILERAVRSRLVADVPVGVFVSGGIDSGLVAAMAHRAQRDIECFSIGFDEPSFDESRYATTIARTLGLTHHLTMFTSREMLAVVDRLPEFMDEPLADASILPFYLLSGIAAKRLRVALTGDGGDELFAGYPTYQAHRIVTYYDSLPDVVKNAVKAVASRLPVSQADISTDFKIKQFLRGAGVSSEIRFLMWMGSFTEGEKRELLHTDLRAALASTNTYEDVFAYVAASGLNKDLERILYLSMKLYLQDDILVKVDRASMAHGLEVRCPLLDQEFVEFACRLPMPYKLRGVTTKYLLKKAAAGLLPDAIIHRRKKGFGIPVSRWLAGDLKSRMLDYLSEDRLARQGLFNYPYVTRLIDDHLARRRDNRKLLWTLLVFQMWYARFVEHQPAQ
jgi:asparagine synthase (glutamine-hydrolysing)